MLAPLIADLNDLTGLLSTFMPRGDGNLLFHPGKIIFITLIFLAWVSTVKWIDQDCNRVSLNRQLWSVASLAGFALGMVAVSMMPHYGLSIILLILLYLSPTLIYVSKRNEIVPPQLKVLTRAHIRNLIKRRLGVDVGAGGKGDEGPLPSIQFIAKNSTQDDIDEARLSKAVDSPGYRAALELVQDAINQRATDIHLEPTRDEMTIRFRVDSIMNSVPSFARSRGDSVINVFKVLAGLDITEKRKPQDGSFGAEVEGRKVDFRLATAGSLNGQKMVIRILDASRQVTTLNSLGLRAQLREKVETVCQQSYGMMITCGPTGAGKTSTLYACLGEIDRFQRNVITLENPVEYQMDNVTQIEVNPKAGKTFAGELRSILRQDPDVILVGEIRDAETAEIACQAAQTGHMVFTTVHANDAVTSVGRLIDLGVKPFMIASALSAVLGQRLVRLLCPKCKIGYSPSDDMLRKLKIKPAPDRKITFYKPKVLNPDDSNADVRNRCEKCKGTGYLGRTGIFELLMITDEIKELIRANPDLVAIRQSALKNGFQTLFEDGLRKVIEGKTSLEEIQRVAK
ncbi:type II/IV secretion system protein [Telmatocola sphagniphila]|uniref:Type II/IV secretion system protein n=1 Tax=Telmatocola sphagniphila TaxID=1123043 RepID=A0A8E6EZ45_9BACT|nr:GspE/PulE family protein [Telmatocola sphagniphila]QVL33353.1 type II/IV secretion system protein [Telmatocola sphagniphila]